MHAGCENQEDAKQVCNMTKQILLSNDLAEDDDDFQVKLCSFHATVRQQFVPNHHSQAQIVKKFFVHSANI